MKKLTRAEAKARQHALLQKTLRKVGYTALKQRGVKSARPDFPDLSVPQRTAPTSDRVGNGVVQPTAASHPDAKQFPVGHLHKQGPVPIFTKDPELLQYYGGKKA